MSFLYRRRARLASAAGALLFFALVASCKGELARSSSSSSSIADSGPPFEGGNGSSACAPQSDPPPIDPAPGPTDAVGSFVHYDGSRAHGGTVEVDGNALPVDAWGRFVVHDAPASYDVLFLDGDAVTEQFGITSRDPSFLVSGGQDVLNSAQITIHFGASSVPTSKFAAFAHELEPQDGLWQLATYADQGVSGDYVWLGCETSADLDVYAFEYVADPNAPPTSFPRWAKATLHFELNQTTTWTPIFQPVPASSTFTAHATVPDGLILYEADLGIVLPSGASSGYEGWGYPTTSLTTQRPDWTFVVPQIDGLSFNVAYTAYTAGMPGSLGGSSSTEIISIPTDGSPPPDPIIAPLATISAPSSGATLGPGTEFSWIGTGDTCDLELVPVDPSNRPYRFTTTARSMTFPDLGAVDANPVSGTSYTAVVSCYSGDSGDAGASAPRFSEGMQGSVSLVAK